MEVCSYCKEEGNKMMKVGPKLRFCNEECYYKDCLKRFPDTSLYDIVARLRPDLVGEVEENR